jgi:hypothetical protein
MSTISGTVISVEEVTTPIDALEIKFTTTNGVEALARFPLFIVDKDSELQDTITGLKKGDLIEVTREASQKVNKFGKPYENPVGVKLLDKLPAVKAFTPVKGSSGAYKTSNDRPGFDASGPIKGNAITNAVNISIFQENTSLENLKENFITVLELHRYAEIIDVNKYLKSGETEAKETIETISKTETVAKRTPRATKLGGSDLI